MIKRRAIPLLVFAVILLHGATIGLTDDEAYYWVLAQKPALGYAYHPPAVALSIALAQRLLGWLFGHHSAGLVRLPAAAYAAGLLALGMRWIRAAGGGERAWSRGGLAMVAFAGMFGLAWMMVPDLPMFFGWTLAFVATWELCFAEKARGALLMLAFGTALAILSKYSGVLGGASALAALWIWAPRERRVRGTAALVAGGLFAAIPILWWNAHHGWASILYQIRERHGDAQLSGVRYLRFWLIELVIMGPPLFVFGAGLVRRFLRRQASRAELFVLVWVLPGALVFCSQPLWAEFKPHWALIVWWPLAMAMGLAWARGESGRLARAQVAYGLSLSALVLLCCHLPVGNWALATLKGEGADPRLDVTNDLYGWSELRQFVESQGGNAGLRMPVVGSRYQTASQAAFAMGEAGRVTMLPRDLKSMDEWPEISVSEGQGPAWPKLLTPVLYVGDNRYDSGPEFPGARCSKLWTLVKKRGGYPAKTIYFWKCEPGAPKG